MRRELKILLSADGLFMLAGGLFGPIYAVFVEQIGGDLLTAGGAYGLYSISAGLLIFLISRWEDRVKHQEKLVVIGYILSTIGFIGYLFIRTPIHLFIVQIILGLGEAVYKPAYDSMYSRHMDKNKFASEWGLWESMYYITTAAAAVIGGFLANMFGFRVVFIFMAVISLIGLATSSILVLKKFYIKQN